MLSNIRPAATAAGLLFSALMSCVPVEPVLNSRPAPADDEILDEARDSFLAGDLSRARELFRQVAWQRGPSSTSADVWYWLGRCNLALGRLEDARRSLLRAKDHVGKSMPGEMHQDDLRDLEARILVALGDVAILQSRPAESLDYLLHIENDGLVSRTEAGEFAYRKAAALEGLGKEGPARKLYVKAARLLRSDPLARESKRRAARLSRARYIATAGVYSARPSAERVASILRKRGLDADVRVIEDNQMFSVVLGQFDTREEASRAVLRASGCGFPASLRAYSPVKREALR